MLGREGVGRQKEKKADINSKTEPLCTLSNNKTRFLKLQVHSTTLYSGQ